MILTWLDRTVLEGRVYAFVPPAGQGRAMRASNRLWETALAAKLEPDELDIAHHAVLALHLPHACLFVDVGGEG